MIKQKWFETKDGQKYRKFISSIDSDVKAAPNPKIEQLVRGIDKKTWNQMKKQKSNTAAKK